MVEPLGIAQALEKLAKKGYTGDFRSSKKGLWLFPSDIEIDPEDLIIDEIYRFEGETNLDDEAIIFALSYPQKNLKGTFLIAFGPMMDPHDAAIVQKLNEIHRKNRNRQ